MFAVTLYSPIVQIMKLAHGGLLSKVPELGSDSEACALSTLTLAYFILLKDAAMETEVSVSSLPARAHYVSVMRLVPSKWQIERLFLDSNIRLQTDRPHQDH